MIDELRSSSIQTVPHQDTCVCMFTMPIWDAIMSEAVVPGLVGSRDKVVALSVTIVV